LKDYLEQKKKMFPRFYFLSDQSLLDILSNGQNALKVCSYLGDCFDQFGNLVFNPPDEPGGIPKKSDAMLSKANERVNFTSTFVAEGQVEGWLSNLEFKIKETLQDIVEGARQSSELWETDKPREEWLEMQCAQISLLVTQIVWTEDVNRSFEDLAGGSETAMKDCLKQCDMRLSALIAKVRQKMSRNERNKVINVITIDVHSRD